MIDIIGLRIINIIIAFNGFISLSGFLFHFFKILQYRKKKNITYYMVYVFFFLSTTLLSIATWAFVNLIPIWGIPNSLTYEMELIVINVARLINSSLALAFIILSLALRMELAELSPLIQKVWYGVTILALIAIAFYLFAGIDILYIEGGLPMLSFSPTMIALVLIPFSTILIFWYGYQNVNNYLREYRQWYKATSFHYLFVVISGLAFLGFGITIILSFLLPPIPEARVTILILISVFLIIFPTLRWTYIEHFRRRVVEYERNDLQDVINHDLANITQIILTLAESIINTENQIKEADVKLLTEQIERIDTLVKQSRNSERSSLIDKF